jgi:hypothetical protein
MERDIKEILKAVTHLADLIGDERIVLIIQNEELLQEINNLDVHELECSKFAFDYETLLAFHPKYSIEIATFKQRQQLLIDKFKVIKSVIGLKVDEQTGMISKNIY